MRKIYMSIISLAIFFSFNVMAQSDTTLVKTEEQIKKGWNFGGLPVISYDSDLGLQLGALVNLYNYGDGSRYPKYDHSIYVEGSWFLKGSGIFRLYYDSDRLIKGINTSIDLSYLPDRLFKFYGFNGYQSVYNSAWVDDADSAYKSRAFYRTDRKFFRAKLDFQGKITNEKFRWMAGVDFYSIKMDTVNVSKLNDGKSEDKMLPDSAGLFQKYNSWGIIPEGERDGGMFAVFKAGLVYDSRNNDALPTKGIWTEAILAMAPKFTSNMDQGFIKFAITHRQYFTLIKDRLSFAYRLGMQVNLAGHTPYYAQGLMYYVTMKGAYNEGLGGAKTIRGIERNRVVGDGIAYGNFEIRYQFWYFSFINQNWYMALSGFFDTGRVIQYINIQDGVNPEVFEDPNYFNSSYLNPYSDGFHSGYGAGLHIGMNQNFIIAIDYGRALSADDGKTGFYVGLNWLF